MWYLHHMDNGPVALQTALSQLAWCLTAVSQELPLRPLNILADADVIDLVHRQQKTSLLD